MVTLKIRFHGFETHTRSRTLNAPTADDTTLSRAAWALFEAEAWAGKPVRLIGLGLSGWAADLGMQPDLFAAADMPEPHPRDSRLSETLDAIRRKFGSGYIRRGLSRRK